MTDPNTADLPDHDDGDAREAGLLPQTADEAVRGTTNEVDADDMFGGGTE